MGETSHKAPGSSPSLSSANEYFLGSPVIMNGTGLVVWAVWGFPVSPLIICSALPWSAVISKMYPASSQAS